MTIEDLVKTVEPESEMGMYFRASDVCPRTAPWLSIVVSLQEFIDAPNTEPHCVLCELPEDECYCPIGCGCTTAI